MIELTCADCLCRKGECDGECGRKKTNADRIRSMTDEELAEWITRQIIDRNIGVPSDAWLDWLKQEVSANNS